MKTLTKILGSLFLLLFISIAAQAQWQHPAAPASTSSLNSESGLPDLVVSKIKLVSLAERDRIYTHNVIKVPVEITILNKGTAVAKSHNSIRNYILRSNTSQLTTGSSAYIRKAIYPGKSVTVRVLLSIPDSLNGKSVPVKAFADVIGRGVIVESNETNNSKSATLKIPRYTRVGKKYADF